MRETYIARKHVRCGGCRKWIIRTQHKKYIRCFDCKNQKKKEYNKNRNFAKKVGNTYPNRKKMQNFVNRLGEEEAPAEPETTEEEPTETPAE